MDLMKRLSKAKTSLILEHPFIGSVALNMPMSLSDEVPTLLPTASGYCTTPTSSSR